MTSNKTKKGKNSPISYQEKETIEESVLAAMDGSDRELYSYLPYILQDLWEMGSVPDVIIKLIAKHFDNAKQLRVLDLGCGKGAVSVKISDRLGCNCHGIDAIPEFIDYAKEKAIEYKVDHLCTFEAGDIRKRVIDLPTYDIIILGAIGPVFGDYYKTLTTLSRCLNKSGIFIIDDGYTGQESGISHPALQTKEAIIQQIDLAGMEIIEEDIIPKEQTKTTNDFVFEQLKMRCTELIDKYPDKKGIFENYIKNQERENELFGGAVVCSTIVIKRGKEATSE